MRDAVTVDFIRHSFQSLLTTKLGGPRESGVMSVVTGRGQILPFSLFLTHLITSMSNSGQNLPNKSECMSKFRIGNKCDRSGHRDCGGRQTLQEQRGRG